MKLGMGTKVIALFLIAGLVPFGITGILSYRTASESLKKQSENNLVAVREIKNNQISDYISNRKNDLKTLSSSPIVSQAMGEFSTAFKALDGAGIRDLYIFKNPYPAGKKLELVDAGDDSEYTKIHKKYHPVFKDFLCNPDTEKKTEPAVLPFPEILNFWNIGIRKSI